MDPLFARALVDTIGLPPASHHRRPERIRRTMARMLRAWADLVEPRSAPTAVVCD
jgi:hypothetical protein